MSNHLIAPHGGALVDPMLPRADAEALRAESMDWPSWALTPRQLADLELILNGSFSPLAGFMGSEEVDAVGREMRLPDGTLWPIPVALAVSPEFAAGLSEGDRVALRDPEGVMAAALEIGEIWTPDLETQAERVYGTKDLSHPGAKRLQPAGRQVGDVLISDDDLAPRGIDQA